MTWEQFAPPHNLNTVNAPVFIELIARQISPAEPGEPFCGERYLLHKGVFDKNEALHTVLDQRHDSARVVTFGGATVGVLSGIVLWVHPAHRRRVVAVDIAAELSLERAVRGGLFRKFAYLEGKPIPMTEAAIAASKRAYHLAVQRGILVPPAGYPMP